jgi:V8-like Glu-specific endopeptidase
LLESRVPSLPRIDEESLAAITGPLTTELQSFALGLPSEPVEEPVELNGRFLSGYDSSRARPMLPSPALVRPLGITSTIESDRVLQSVETGTESGTESSGVSFDPQREIIVDASNLLPFRFLRDGDRLGRAVVKIQRADGASGTGFLVAPDILLTNHHVLPDEATASTSRALANYEKPPPGDSRGRSTVVRLEPRDFFVSNAELDFAFCGVHGLDFLGTVPLDRNSLSGLQADYVNIIQHPRGRPKEIALQDNRVIRSDNIVIHYSCDTEPGSSGSPVFNNQWDLVALHHASVSANLAEGSDRGSDDASSRRFLNEGIRLSAIAAWIETLDAEQAIPALSLKRLRSIFQGLDPQMGFFGALGRRTRGSTAADVVVELYGDQTSDYDVGFWDLSGHSGRIREQVSWFGRQMSDLGLDLWCLAGILPADLRALCDELSELTHRPHDYSAVQAAGQIPFGLISRRVGNVMMKRACQVLDRVPACFRLEFQRASAEPVVLHLVPVCWTSGEAGMVDPICEQMSHALLESVIRRLAPSEPATDWILMGGHSASVMSGPERQLSSLGFEAMVATTGRETLTWLAGPGTGLSRVFVSSNLSPVRGSPERMVVTRDRGLPPELVSGAGARPIAARLSLTPVSEPAGGAECVAKPPEVAAVSGAAEPLRPQDEDDLERRLTDLLRPVVSRLVADLKGRDPQEGN